VTGGTLEVWVDYLGFHVYSSSGDLCEAIDCPLAQGEQALTFRQKLPRVAPPVSRGSEGLQLGAA
jgi:hypothetical protein